LSAIGITLAGDPDKFNGRMLLVIWIYAHVLVLSRQPGDHVLYINEDQREFLLPLNTAWDVIRIGKSGTSG